MAVARATLTVETHEDGTNVAAVVCQYCDCKILPSKKGLMDTRSVAIPAAGAKGDTTVTTEEVSAFWLVDDMFTFDNIGFAHAVGDHKYLCCADCERGPLGVMLVSTKEILLACDRVYYVPGK